jgi:hypothetical protein
MDLFFIMKMKAKWNVLCAAHRRRQSDWSFCNTPSHHHTWWSIENLDVWWICGNENLNPSFNVERSKWYQADWFRLQQSLLCASLIFSVLAHLIVLKTIGALRHMFDLHVRSVFCFWFWFACVCVRWRTFVPPVRTRAVSGRITADLRSRVTSDVKERGKGRGEQLQKAQWWGIADDDQEREHERDEEEEDDEDKTRQLCAHPSRA